jgi:hypothetical protein
MFEQIVRESEALGLGASQMRGSLIPALKGCPECFSVQMIAAPSLGLCSDCGSRLIVWSANHLQQLSGNDDRPDRIARVASPSPVTAQVLSRGSRYSASF